MIKIPKSLNELKQMVSEVNLNEAMTKVQTSINAASEAVKGGPVVEGDIGELINQLKKNQEQQILLLNQLARVVADFQQQLAVQAPPQSDTTSASAVSSGTTSPGVSDKGQETTATETEPSAQ